MWGRHFLMTRLAAVFGAAALLACGPAVAAGSAAQNNIGQTSTAAAGAGPMTRFVLKCYDRAFNGDPTVYDDCFTEDFKAIGPETRMISTEPDGSLRGRAYIKAYHDMNHGDATAWNTLKFDTVWSLETGDTVVRLMRDSFADPKGSYAGIENIPPDRQVVIDGIFVDRLRDGKIASLFFTYDTMRFLTDIAGGDTKQVAAALIRMDAMMAQMRKAAVPGPPVAPH